MPRLVLVFAMLFLAALSTIPFLPMTAAQISGSSVLYVSPPTVSTVKPNSSYTPSFSVDVSLNLSSTDKITGYDIFLGYNDTVLNATAIHLGSFVPTDRVFVSKYCVNGLGSECNGALDGPGVVHSSVDIAGTLAGPMSGSLFSVQFSVLKTGHSFLALFNDTIFGELLPSGVPPPLIHVSWSGVYSNHGLQAFFNVAPAILFVGQPVQFDASATFNPDNSSLSYRSSLLYSWDFGDGSVGTGLAASHTYSSSGNYWASLLATDPYGGSSLINRVVPVVLVQGSIRVAVRDTLSRNVNQSVTLRLYNGSALVSTVTRKSGFYDPFFLSALIPGTYRLDFSGIGITAYSKQETVVAGQTTEDVVYLTVQNAPSDPGHASSGTDVWTYILLAGIVVVGGAGGLSMIQQRLHGRRRKSSTTRAR